MAFALGLFIASSPRLYLDTPFSLSRLPSIPAMQLSLARNLFHKH